MPRHAFHRAAAPGVGSDPIDPLPVIGRSTLRDAISYRIVRWIELRIYHRRPLIRHLAMKPLPWAALGLLSSSLVAAPALAVEQPSGPDAAACALRSGETAVLLRVARFKDGTGNLRVELYADWRDDFLRARGRLRRIEMPVAATNHAICLEVPRPGNYAIVVHHDRNANGKFDVTTDGVGFTRNPRLGLSKPELRSVVMAIGPGLTSIDITMNYRRGLGVVPLL